MTYTTYTGPGAFSDGGPPGISAAVMNAIENMLLAGWFDSLITSDGSGGLSVVKQTLTGPTNNNMAPVTVTGQTSGRADMYQYMQGSAVLKTIIHLVNYRITANQTLALPTPYVDRSSISVWETNGGHLACLHSGAAVNIKVISAVSATGGTTSTQTFIQQFSSGMIDAAWDTLQLQSANQLGIANGLITIEGY